MSSRDAILGKIRRSLGAAAGDASRLAEARKHMAAPVRHPTPGRVAGKTAEELSAVLRAQLEAAAIKVLEVPDDAGVPEALSGYLREHNMPQRVRMGADPRLAAINWGKAAQLTVQSGRADPSDEASVSHATAAVAETGTIVLASGEDNPVTLTFMPETHIVVVRRSDVVGPYEDAFARVREQFGAGQMPRTVNMVSGPSRTGDIAGKIVMGAHGPRRMCVILVG